MLETIVSPRRVFLDLAPAPKAELLAEFARRLAGAGELTENPADIARALVKREDIVSTGVRTGFAFPHAFAESLESLSLSIGRAPEGVDFQSLDGEPVEFVLLLLGPPSPRHLRVLARLSRIVGADGALEAFRAAADAGADALVDLVLSEDRRIEAEGGARD